jgi:CheY-like chemotaxis protein
MSKTRPTIAIVDEDESVYGSMSRLLRSVGMNTDTFTSGHEFIEHIETMPSFHPDCVVLDVQMPGMNGLEMQEHLVRGEKTLPVIFISALDEVSVRERAWGQVRWPSCASRSMTSCLSKHSTKLLNGTGRRQAKDSGRVHGGAGWCGG